MSDDMDCFSDTVPEKGSGGAMDPDWQLLPSQLDGATCNWGTIDNASRGPQLARSNYVRRMSNHQPGLSARSLSSEHN